MAPNYQFWDFWEDERASKMEHNKAMLQYSQFVIGQQLTSGEKPPPHLR
jgi:hypothetical protein